LSGVIFVLPSHGSKVRVLRDGLAMLREMLAVRRNDARGLYAARQRFPVSG